MLAKDEGWISFRQISTSSSSSHAFESIRPPCHGGLFFEYKRLFCHHPTHRFIIPASRIPGWREAMLQNQHLPSPALSSGCCGIESTLRSHSPKNTGMVNTPSFSAMVFMPQMLKTVYNVGKGGTHDKENSLQCQFVRENDNE